MPENSIEAHVLNLGLRLADTWRLGGSWQDARILLTGLQPVAEKVSNVAQANLWLQLGLVMTDESLFGGRDNLDERENALNRALAIGKTIKNSNLIGNVYDALGSSAHMAYLTSDRSQEPEYELDFFERGLELRKESGTTSEIAESLFHIGLVFDVIREDTDQALPYHEEAYKLAREAGDKVMASFAIRHIGYARLDAEDLDGAKQALEESLSLREDAGFTPGVAFALATLAHVDSLEGDKAKALSRLEHSRKILESLDAAPRVSAIDEQIASLSKN